MGVEEWENFIQGMKDDFRSYVAQNDGNVYIMGAFLCKWLKEKGYGNYYKEFEQRLRPVFHELNAKMEERKKLEALEMMDEAIRTGNPEKKKLKIA